MKKIKSMLVIAMMAVATAVSAQSAAPRSVYAKAGFVSDGGREVYAIGYRESMPLSKTQPLYLSASAELQYWHEMKSLFSTNVPVEINCEIKVPGTPIAVTPLAGIDFKYHFAGNDYIEKEVNQFNVGLHAGVNIGIGKCIYVGASYGQDLMDFFDGGKGKVKTTSVTLGFKF